MAAEVEHLKQEVAGITAVLAPAFSPSRREAPDVPEPMNTVSGSRTAIDWSRWPDHDPDYLAGRITLEQAKARHPRPDERCQCPNCTAERRHMAQRYAMSEPERQAARCPVCHGSGLRGDAFLTAGSQLMNWALCAACRADELFRLQETQFHVRSEFGNPAMASALDQARARVAGCGQCQGTGKTWQAAPPAPCAACKDSGRDDHIVTPPGTLWRKASAGGDYVKDTTGGKGVEQQSFTVPADPEPTGLPVPDIAPPDGMAAGQPEFMTARAMGARITYPRGS